MLFIEFIGNSLFYGCRVLFKQSTKKHSGPIFIPSDGIGRYIYFESVFLAIHALNNTLLIDTVNCKHKLSCTELNLQMEN